MTAIEQKAAAGERAGAKGHKASVLDVARWELRRLAASWRNWAAVAGTFLFFAGFIWFKHAWLLNLAKGGRLTVTIIGMSPYGLLYEFVNVLLLLFALFIPFVVTDAVTRDYKRRMHEVLMTTPMGKGAYVWGRFLAALTVSLFLAIIMLLAVIVMSRVLAGALPGYPTPELVVILRAWAVTVVPATIFLAAVGFSLGTGWPRQATIMTLAMLVAWVMLFVFGFRFAGLAGNVQVYLNPTSDGILQVVIPDFEEQLQARLAQDPGAKPEAVAAELQSVQPDLSPWVVPHTAVAVAGLVLVALTAARFKRFRDVLE